MTHDEAANQCSALREAKKEALVKHPGSSWKSVVCTAHRLQNCIKRALDVEDVTTLLAAARKLVSHFRHSLKATVALKMKQPAGCRPKKVIQDVATHWNSTYYMLQRLTELHLAIVAVLSDKNVSKPADASLDLSAYQWMLASQLIKVLAPFESATRLMSADQNVSLSFVVPVMEGLARGVIVNDDDNEAISEVKTILREQLTNRFELDSLDADSLPVLASLLDPRFKNTQFFPDAEDKQVAKSALLALLRTERARRNYTVDEAESSDASKVDPPPAKRHASAADWDAIGKDFEDDTPARGIRSQRRKSYGGTWTRNHLSG